MKTIDCAIIGAGPAGLAAALQAKRQGMSVTLLEKDRPGGQALVANLIENFPGCVEGISGRDLMRRFVDQVEAHGVEVSREEVVRVSMDGLLFRIKSKVRTRQSKTVVVATGLSPKRLGIPGEAELIGNRIFSYVDPDTVAHDGKRVLVIGSGDAAFDQALNFSKKAKGVTIAMKHSEPKCNPILNERVERSAIEVLASHVASGFQFDGSRLIASFEGGAEIEVDLAIVCAGKEQCFGFIDPPCMNAPGMFFAGDCRRGLDRHIVIACGDGTAAAMAAHSYLVERA